jgi:hypothetical protein
VADSKSSTSEPPHAENRTAAAEAAEAAAALNQREPVESYSAYWTSREKWPLAKTVHIILPPSGQIGIGVKVFKGVVTVSSFKFSIATEQRVGSVGFDA